MGTVLIDGQEVEVGDHERINGIQAARRIGVEVPHYCWHAGLTVVASCRMCLVETGTKHPETGQVTMLPKLVPACQTPAKPGTVFVTDSEKIRQARAFVEEGLLIDHPIDCPICDKAGECLLQDYHFEHGQKERRADIRPFTSRRREMGSTVTLFVDRCVMCSRCVRFTREVAGASELMVINRGSHEEIDVMPGFPLENKMSGNVVNLCPVGALGDRDFLYQQRVWFMKNHAHVCTGCSTGCSIWIDENQDHVYRLRPRENQAVNQYWMCDEGRYGYHHVHDEARLTEPGRREKDRYVPLDWSVAPAEIKAKLAKAGRIAAVLSPHLTVEEAYLLAKLVRTYDAQAALAIGPVPVVGQDEKFKSGFTIHAEKCPNRRGVEEVIKFFTGKVTTLDELAPRLAAGEFKVAWVTGGYKKSWIEEATAAQLAGAPILIVQDMFPSPLWERATYRLPGVSFAERDGSFVNYAGRLQSVRWAIRPPVGARIEGSIYWHMLGGVGMYNPRTVLAEIGTTVPAFAAVADGVPSTGVDLKQPQPA